MTLTRKLSLGLLTAGLVGGAVLGRGDPPAGRNPFREPSPVQPAGFRAVEIELSTRSEQPAAALEWAGPNSLKVGERGEYTLTVRNTCGQPLQKVVVQMRVPKDAVHAVAPPVPAASDGVYRWEVGTLEPAAVVPVRLTLVGQARGSVGCQAWVTVTGTAGMTVAVREPKLACKVVAPESVAVGDPLRVEYVLTNAGDTRLENVVLRRGAIDHPVRPLAPGEECRVQIEERPTAGGVRTFPASAVGSEGTAAEATAKTRVLVPKLTATVTGPAERMVGRKAAYTLTVTNAGELPLEKVTVAAELPAGLRLIDKDGSVSGRTKLTAEAAALAPGQSLVRTFEAVAATPGVGRVAVTAAGSRGTAATAECVTKVDGVPAIRMEVVDLADPVEVGGTTTYEVRVLNTGSKAAAAVALVCELPDALRYAGCDGPTAGRELERVGVDFNVDGKTRTRTTVTFDPIAELAPKTEAVYRVKVKAVGTGDVRFKATLTSTSLSAPVAKEESTRVFGE